MSIRTVRDDLERLRTYVQDGQTDEALATIEHALDALEPERLLTTTEAARVLNIRSVNTLKLLLRREGIRVVRRGNRTMVPLAEIERLQTSELVRGIRASDRMHDAIESLGGSAGLSDDELEELEAGRPGRLPWEAPLPEADR